MLFMAILQETPLAHHSRSEYSQAGSLFSRAAPYMDKAGEYGAISRFQVECVITHNNWGIFPV